MAVVDDCAACLVRDCFKQRVRINNCRLLPADTSVIMLWAYARFLLLARAANAFSSSRRAMRSGVAAKLSRRGRSTVIFWKPKSLLSNTLLTTRGLVRGWCDHGVLVGEVAGFAVGEVAMDSGQVVDLELGEFVALVTEAAAHLLEHLPSVDELHFACTVRFFAVGQHPDIGGDAGVVEHLVGQGHNRLQPVVLDDPPADFAFAASRRPR